MTGLLKAALAGLLFCLASCAPATSLPQAPTWMVEDGRAHFDTRVREIAALPKTDQPTLLLGDSITEGWMWQSTQPGPRVLNHGVGWDVSEGLLAREGQYAGITPARVLIMIGTNDLSYGRTPDQVVPFVREVVEGLQGRASDAEIVLQSVLPREADKRAAVDSLNANYAALARDLGVDWLDLVPAFSAPDGSLRPDLTDDGLHLNRAGYALWAQQLQVHDAE